MAKANRRLRKPSSHTRLGSRVAILDMLWGGFSPLAAFLLRDGTINSPNGVLTYCGISFLTSLLVFQWFQTSSPLARFYSVRDAFELVKACVLIAALSAVISFVLTRLEEAPRSIPILHFMALTLGLLGARLLLRMRDTRRETRRSAPADHVEHILIVGASRLAWFFSKMVEELAPGRYQIVAILDESAKLRHRSLNGYPIVGTPADLEKLIADYAMHGVSIDKVVLAEQPEDLTAEAWSEIRRVCETLNVGLEVLPERLVSASPSPPADADDESAVDPDAPVPESKIHVSPYRFFWRAKRVADFTIALALALVLLPLILVVVLLVLLDVGVPAIFWQQRVGRHGAALHLYKFRTLKTLYDRRTGEKREAQAPSAIGRFLRKTRLDELPQLWNVLAGDMSLIGPRPLLPVDQPQGPTERLTVRPGVTGWAQICGGKLVSVEEKNALDEWYIRHASLQLDLFIVLRTIGTLFKGDRRNEKAIALALLEKSNSEVTQAPPDVAAGERVTALAGILRETGRIVGPDEGDLGGKRAAGGSLR